jgi:DNA processing protein
MNIKTLMPTPNLLKNISSPPKNIYYIGADIETLLKMPRLAIVGSRKVSSYGSHVTTQLARQVAGQGIVIVSGLAFGVDALAHRAALDAGGLTIAVLPGPLDNIAPRTHRRLAKQILESGGALISEYPCSYPVKRENFIARNRIVSGISDAVLITEAAQKSGSLHTARFALEQGKDVLAVPGNITSATSQGANSLIKAGATPITSVSDVLYALGLDITQMETSRRLKGANQAEDTILGLLKSGVSDGDELHKGSNLLINDFNQTLTMLEITGSIRPLGNNKWTLS